MDKFKVGDVVWTDVPHFFQEAGHIGFTPKVGMVVKTDWDTCSEFYTIETDSEPIDRVESEIYPLFDATDLDELKLDYKLVLEQNQELLESIKDTREWLERRVKLHNAMVRTIVEGERKILDTIKQEEE